MVYRASAKHPERQAWCIGSVHLNTHTYTSLQRQGVAGMAGHLPQLVAVVAAGPRGKGTPLVIQEHVDPKLVPAKHNRD